MLDGSDGLVYRHIVCRRPEYCRRAAESLGRFRDKLLIVDSGDANDAPQPKAGEVRWSVFRPFMPYTHTQTHNYFQKLAMMRAADFYLVMHADAEATEETIQELVRRAREDVEAGKKIAVWFTNYDSLAAYSVAAAREIGPWDWQLLPSYYSENDFYWRCKVAGWEIVDTGFPVAHLGSHIINKVDRWRKLYTRLRMDHWRALYIEKWGGDVGKEIYRSTVRHRSNEGTVS